MNAKEKRAALVKELDSLVDGVKSGDEAATTRADEIMTELASVDELLEKATEKADMMAKLGQTTEKATMEKGDKMSNSKSLGDAVVEAVKGAGLVRGKINGTAHAEVKAATDTVVSPYPGEISISDRVVVYPNGPLYVRDLLPTEFVTTPTVGFFQVPTEGSAAGVAEDGAKPQMSAEPELVTVRVGKIAAILKATDELIQDYPRLVSTVEGRGVYAKDLEMEDQIINGNGTGGEMTGLLNAGIQTGTWANGGTAQDIAEAIYGAAMRIRFASGYDADGVIVNPLDWLTLRLAKDGNDQYFAGGMFEGQYGTAFGGMYPGLWGMKIAISNACPQGTIIVGAFRQAAALAVKDGTRVDVGYDGVDFSHDRVTIRVEERAALEVFVPGAFYALTEAE
jgi:HK97 family phage major capsid protein